MKRTRVDTGIARHDHDTHATDITDATDDRTTGNGSVGVGRIVEIARQGRQLQPGRAGIEQPRDTLAWQQLAAPVEQRLGLGGGIARARFE